MNQSTRTIKSFRRSGTIDDSVILRVVTVLFVIFLIPAVAGAHRSVLCDGKKTVDIFLPPDGIAQIQATEPITGVYPSTPQKAEFVVYDKGRPQHLFRMDAAKMEGSEVVVHVNTMAHQCLLRVATRPQNWDSVVTLTYPPSARQLQAQLPPALRQSPVRQMWFAMWVTNKENAPAGVKVTELKQEVKGWLEGLKVEIHYRYSMPGYDGFTQEIANVSSEPLRINPSELKDLKRPHHSISITDTLGIASILHPHGDLKPGEKALLHIVYPRGGR